MLAPVAQGQKHQQQKVALQLRHLPLRLPLQKLALAVLLQRQLLDLSNLQALRLLLQLCRELPGLCCRHLALCLMARL